MSKSFFNSRRNFIKLASGVAVSPLFTLPSSKVFAADKPNLRCLICIDTYGLPGDKRAESFIRSMSGDYPLQAEDLGNTLKPLAAYINNMLIPSNISLDSRSVTKDSQSHHYLSTHTLSGSSALIESREIEANMVIQHASIDVRIGQYLHNDYGLPSSRIYEHLFFTDYSQRGSTTFCYTESGLQKRSIAGAQTVRDSLFSNDGSVDQSLNSVTNSAHLNAFSLIKERLNGLSGNLENSNTSEVVGAYQESMESISRQWELKSDNIVTMPDELINIENGGGLGKTNPNDVPDMFKNIYHAFKSDLVSCITYAFGGEKINQQAHGYLYNEEDHDDADLQALLKRNYHASSHRTDDVADKAHEVVRAYQSQELATLLDRLSETEDADGSMMIDNTVVFFTSQMSDNTHNTALYPYFIIAGKNTNLQGGFHYDCEGSTNNDLLTTLAQGLTLPDESFGGHDRYGDYQSSLNNGPITKMLKS